MLNWLKYVRLVKQIDGLCFKKRTWIIPKLLGKPGYEGCPPRRAFFSVPIFFHYGRVGPLALAIHEVRHKIQWHNPKMSLLGVQDIPQKFLQELMPYFRPGAVEKLSPREIDAEIIEHIALPLFLTNQTSAFLELMLGKAKPPKES